MCYKAVISLTKFMILAFMLLACSELPEYDLVIKNANYLDLETGKFISHNIGINNGKIAAISDELLEGKEVIDAQNQYVYPGFIDAHCHFYGYAQGLLSVNLVGTKSMNEIVERIKQFEKQHAEQTVIFGRGWDQNDWENNQFPTNELLNSNFPNKTVVLTRIDGHAALVNEKGVLEMGPLPDSVSGGQILRVEGKTTGLFIDEAMQYLPSQKINNQDLIGALKMAESNCFSMGLTGLADAGLPESAIRFLDSLESFGELNMPMNVMLADNKSEIESLFSNGPFLGERIKSKSIKVYSDGALGSRGALLLKPYTDNPGHFGLSIKQKEDLRQLCVDAKSKGLQVNVHAIGDSANRMVLQVFAEVLGGKNDLRWRVEHAQIVEPSDSIYFINYSILPSVQPTHATSDMYWAEERLGHERINHAYSYKDLYKWSNGHMPLGTDFPVEDIDPRKTLYAAVTRQDSLMYPEGGFLPSQKLTRLQALQGMTEEAAYAQFEENETGSIAVGKWANLFISPSNLLECPEKDILKAKIKTTVLRGKVVYDANK